MSALEPAVAQTLAAFALLCARVLPIAWFAPWVGVRRMPVLLALSLTFVLALCLLPVASPAGPLPLAALPLAALALREAALGLVYALALALPVRAFEWAGQLMGRFAGAGSGAESAYARLQLWLALAAFFAIGGHRVAISALADSVVARPLGAFTLSPNLQAVVLGSVRLLADAYTFALLLALPLAAAIALAEVALALASRAAWASALSLAAAPGRAALALVVVWMSVLVGLSALPREIERGLEAAAGLLHAL